MKMTKRAFPFEPHICRQMKIHINNYENDVNALKDMEEKTLLKLINGSKNLNSASFNITDDQSFACNSDNENSNKHYIQKCVTSYFTVNGRIVNEKINNIISKPEVLLRCFFCDREIHSGHQCARCLEFYCNSCSFANYESCENNTICLTCS